MNDDEQSIGSTNSSIDAVEAIKRELEANAPSKKKRIFQKFALAALGSIPWVGGFIGAAVSLKTEEGGIKEDNLQTKWLEEHERKMELLGAAMNDIGSRFEVVRTGIVGDLIS